MSDNEIIMESNKEAFFKRVSPKEYVEDYVENIEDIPESHDFREDKEHRGAIANCYYCGTCIRIDGLDDYETHDSLTHCDDCMNNAIWENCM